MRKIITFITIIYTSFIFSQTSLGNELIAQGIAKTKVKPDIASFEISVRKENSIEKTAIKELNEEIQKLQKVLLKIGLNEKNIKIATFKVSKNYYNNRNDVSVVNTLSVNFTLDNKTIERFYQEIQNENLEDLDIDFATSISEDLEKTTRKKLVQLAIENAKENAENISKALDVKLENVKQVSKQLPEYTYSNIKVDKVAFAKPLIAETNYDNPKTSFDQFDVVETEMEETITIIYSIVKK